MKLYGLLLVILFYCCNNSVFPTTINGRFTVTEISADKISVLMQINTDTGTDDLGGTTIVFSFDTLSISFPGSPVNEIDYTFINFNDGNYSSATVTRPLINQIWVNIDLPYTNNSGTIVAAEPGWTDVVIIYFDVVDSSNPENLSWLTASPFWGIFDADNSTLWQNGQFEGFPTSIEPGNGELPTSFGLSQNYPNPFNPSTRIRYQVSSISFVSLVVYDILGNKVATLVNEEKSPGTYEVEFSNSTGTSFRLDRNLTSGVYFYTLKADEFIQTKKMLLLK